MGLLHDCKDAKFMGLWVETRMESFRMGVPLTLVGDFHRDPDNAQAIVEMTYTSVPALREVLAVVEKSKRYTGPRDTTPTADPQAIADDLATVLPRRVNIYDVEIVMRTAAPKCTVRAKVGKPNSMSEIAGVGPDLAAAVADLHDAAHRYEVKP